MDIALEDLRTYARCPLEWFWERRAGLTRPQTIAALVPAALRTALGFYYGGHVEDLLGAVGLVWQDWCEGWGDAAMANELVQYAVGRARILNLFATGRVHRPDGGHYAVPEMTNEYRARMHSAGLTHLGRKLDDFARTHGLLAVGEDDRPGSAFGDALAECLTAAERTAPDLPARDVVLGWQVPYQVDLENGVRLSGNADLLAEAPAGEGAVVVEVHDFEATPWVRAGVASRDLRVIAASLASPVDAGEQAAGRVLWKDVDHVTWRHWPTGQKFEFRETNTGHLLALVTSIARGMRCHVVIPRAVTGYETCRACAYREHCWGPAGWETLSLVDPGMLGYAEHLRTVIKQLQAAIGRDGRAEPRVGVVLDVLNHAIDQQCDDSDIVQLLAAGKHVLEARSHE